MLPVFLTVIELRHLSSMLGIAKENLLILGCPTQGMRQTPAMQAFIASISQAILDDLPIACFDTRFRGAFWMLSAAPAMAKQCKTRGVEPIVQPESFYVKSMKREGPLLLGEIERAVNWAHMLSEKIGAHSIAQNPLETLAPSERSRES